MFDQKKKNHIWHSILCIQTCD